MYIHLHRLLLIITLTLTNSEPPYRPSTPIYDLLEHRYQERWLEERREAERKQREKIQKKKLHGKIYETRASLFRRYSEPVDPSPLWKMRRWQKVKLLIA